MAQPRSTFRRQFACPAFNTGRRKVPSSSRLPLFTREDADFLNESLCPQQFDWLRARLEKMHKALSPIVKNLTAEPAEPTVSAP